MNSVADVWDNVLSQLKGELSETTIATWFDELEAVDIQGNTFILHCSNDFKKGYIESLFMKNIKASLHDIFSTDFEVKILDDLDYAELKDNRPHRQSERFTSAEFTFETFVVGPSNKLAYAASVSVAEHPAQNYNPLLIYGDSGLGKTHLIYAIANVIRRNDPRAKIAYVKGDDLTNELVDAIREGKTAEMREKYRQADLLLVDDIHFIAGKEQTQEEFFNTFNNLYEAGRQIVLTSDRPPSDMLRLEDRLRTRFEWGLTADVQPPDFETRVAIVKRKAELLHLDLPEDVAEFIANHLKNNIRQLEGAVKKLNAYYMLEGIQPVISVAQNAIKDILNETQPVPVTIEKIIGEVSRTFNVSPADIRGTKRNANVASARRVAIYILREVTGMSMEEIGREFSGRDHSTIVYSLKTMERDMKNDQHLRETVSDIIKNVKA